MFVRRSCERVGRLNGSWVAMLRSLLTPRRWAVVNRVARWCLECVSKKNLEGKKIHRKVFAAGTDAMCCSAILNPSDLCLA